MSFQAAWSSVLVTFHLSAPSRTCLWESKTNLAGVEIRALSNTAKAIMCPLHNDLRWVGENPNRQNTGKWRMRV